MGQSHFHWPGCSPFKLAGGLLAPQQLPRPCPSACDPPFQFREGGALFLFFVKVGAFRGPQHNSQVTSLFIGFLFFLGPGVLGGSCSLTLGRRLSSLAGSYLEDHKYRRAGLAILEQNDPGALCLSLLPAKRSSEKQSPWHRVPKLLMQSWASARWDEPEQTPGL